MKARYLVLVLCGFHAVAFAVANGPDLAPTLNRAANGSDYAEEYLSGIVIDNTVTFVGREFYRHFARAWSQEGLHNGYNLVVGEQPATRYGSRVWVAYEGRRQFETFLSATRRGVEETALQAARLLAKRFEVMEAQKLLFDNPDLADDEF